LTAPDGDDRKPLPPGRNGPGLAAAAAVPALLIVSCKKLLLFLDRVTTALRNHGIVHHKE
jgi:hypothetical protein